MKFIKGYRAVDIPLESGGAAMHSIYIREHSDRHNKTGNGKVLFVGNVDYMQNMTHENIDDYLRCIFSPFGSINGISVSAFKDGMEAKSRFAHIEFEKKTAVKLAMQASEQDYLESGKTVAENWSTATGSSTAKTAIEIRLMYPFVDESAEDLQEEVDDFMATFEENELFQKQEKERRLNEADEDGFMPVKNRNKRKRSSAADDTTGRTSKKHQRARQKKNLELKDFYRFQIREDRVQKLDTLRKKFDEDKQRVAKMKEERKFKPF